MKKIALTSLFALAIAVLPAFAGTTVVDKKQVIVEPTCNFRDTEFQIDGFFAGVAARGNTLHSGVGGGTALNFFFAKYFGVGVEGLWYSNRGVAENIILGDAYLRYPICAWNIAPYITAGGGAGWAGNNGHSVGIGHWGAGVEWRFLPHWGVFGDYRMFYGSANLANVFRAGVRFAF
ncbi:MAG: hypothetical protein ABI443_13880 [Chthoniobacterales bacterium]